MQQHQHQQGSLSLLRRKEPCRLFGAAEEAPCCLPLKTVSMWLQGETAAAVSAESSRWPQGPHRAPAGEQQEICINPEANTIRSINCAAAAAAAAGCVVAGVLPVVLGGSSSSSSSGSSSGSNTALASVEMCDPVRHSAWINLPPMLQQRQQLAAVAVGNMLMAMGGRGSTGNQGLVLRTCECLPLPLSPGAAAATAAATAATLLAAPSASVSVSVAAAAPEVSSAFAAADSKAADSGAAASEEDITSPSATTAATASSAAAATAAAAAATAAADEGAAQPRASVGLLDGGEVVAAASPHLSRAAEGPGETPRGKGGGPRPSLKGPLGAWGPLPSMRQARCRFPALHVRGKVFCVGCMVVGVMSLSLEGPSLNVPRIGASLLLWFGAGIGGGLTAPLLLVLGGHSISEETGGGRGATGVSFENKALKSAETLDLQAFFLSAFGEKLPPLQQQQHQEQQHQHQQQQDQQQEQQQVQWVLHEDAGLGDLALSCCTVVSPEWELSPFAASLCCRLSLVWPQSPLSPRLSPRALRTRPVAVSFVVLSAPHQSARAFATNSSSSSSRSSSRTGPQSCLKAYLEAMLRQQPSLKSSSQQQVDLSLLLLLLLLLQLFAASAAATGASVAAAPAAAAAAAAAAGRRSVPESLSASGPTCHGPSPQTSEELRRLLPKGRVAAASRLLQQSAAAAAAAAAAGGSRTRRISPERKVSHEETLGLLRLPSGGEASKGGSLGSFSPPASLFFCLLSPFAQSTKSDAVTRSPSAAGDTPLHAAGKVQELRRAFEPLTATGRVREHHG
ncbi:hypothetical protein Emag_000743 [Eimeria magna]